MGAEQDVTKVDIPSWRVVLARRKANANLLSLGIVRVALAVSLARMVEKNGLKPIL